MKDRNEYAGTPLMFAAAFNQNPEVIETLIKYGAGVNDRSKYDMTTLMCAAGFNRNPRVIDTLIKHGADVKIKDDKGKTALDYAKKNPKIYRTKAYQLLSQKMYE